MKSDNGLGSDGSRPGAASAPPGGGPQTGGNWIHPQAVLAIRHLEWRAKVVCQGFWSGLHRSPVHGFSVEFTEYRPYTPGDDPRYLDWRLYARSDRYYIKKFEDETNLRCHVLLDMSRSMQYGSLSYTKADYAGTLAATLAYFLYRQGDAVGLIAFDEEIREYLPARHRVGHLRRFMLALEKMAGGRGTDLARPLRRAVELVHKRGLVIFISDLLAPIGNLEKNLALLTASGHEVVVLQVLDPAELAFSFQQAVLFQDLESERDLYVDPGLIREDYLRQLKDHQAAVRSACRTLDVRYECVGTDRPLEGMLYSFLRSRLDRQRRIRRSGMSGRRA